MCCTRKNKITMPYSGYSYVERCEREEFKDGLCRYHYFRSQEKKLQWQYRKGYEQISERTFYQTGSSFKLKTDNANILYRLRNETIQKYNKKLDRWDDTSIPVDISLFCFKYS